MPRPSTMKYRDCVNPPESNAKENVLGICATCYVSHERHAQFIIDNNIIH